MGKITEKFEAIGFNMAGDTTTDIKNAKNVAKLLQRSNIRSKISISEQPSTREILTFGLLPKKERYAQVFVESKDIGKVETILTNFQMLPDKDRARIRKELRAMV